MPEKDKKSLKIKPEPQIRKSKEDLAREYQAMINAGIVKNQAELARKLGVSRARISNVLKQSD